MKAILHTQYPHGEVAVVDIHCSVVRSRPSAGIFGEFIDKYLLQDAELDGATVPILYEGRTVDSLVKDAPGLDELFEDMFRDYTPQELALIKAKYATEGDVLEAPLLIQQKARDMLWHYVGVVMPEGYKAQVVATSRQAAITYREKLLNARDELSAKLAALSSETLALSDDELEKADAETQFLVSAHPALSQLNALETAVVISGDHNDPESWWDWSDKSNQEDYMKQFKRKLAIEKTEKTDPLSILVVNNMLLTGFDAPVEQVMYLDRKIVAHDLLQAIARVNRTGGAKKCGYVVDYIGVARHLNEALHDYDGENVEGSLIDIKVELPKLLDRRARAVAIFNNRGITDDAVLGSRIVGGGTLRGGMPFYKYVANRFLAVFQNAFTGAKLSEYHTGSEDVLANLPLRSHGV